MHANEPHLSHSWQARNLKELIEKALNRKAFLDSDDLGDLADLCDHVRESDTLVLLQTKNVLTRPWCVVERMTALPMRMHLTSLCISHASPGASSS